MAFRNAIAFVLLGFVSLTLMHEENMALGAFVRGPVPSGGACVNEGDFKTGNHCVLMRGSELDDFQKKTSQDFGQPKEWCVCLHLFDQLGGKSTYPGGDTSACSKAALSAAQ